MAYSNGTPEAITVHQVNNKHVIGIAWTYLGFYELLQRVHKPQQIKGRKGKGQGGERSSQRRLLNRGSFLCRNPQ